MVDHVPDDVGLPELAADTDARFSVRGKDIPFRSDLEHDLTVRRIDPVGQDFARLTDTRTFTDLNPMSLIISIQLQETIVLGLQRTGDRDAVIRRVDDACCALERKRIAVVIERYRLAVAHLFARYGCGFV